MNLSTSPLAHPNPWLIVAYAALMQAVVVGIGVYAFAFFVMPWMIAFELDRGALMLVITGSSIVAALIAPLCGTWIDKHPSRKLVVSTSVLFAIGLVLIGLFPSYLTTLMVYVLVLPLGICLSGTLMALTLVGKLFTRHRGVAMGLVALGTNVGGLIVPVLVTGLLSQLPWQQVFLVLASLVVLLVSLPAMVVLRGVGGATPTDRSDCTKPSIHPDSGTGTMSASAVHKLGVAYLVPCLLFVAVLHNIGALAADLGIDQQRAAMVTAAASIAMGVGKVAAGALSDKFSYTWLYTSCLLLISGGLVAISQSSGLVDLLFSICLIGLVMGAIAPLVGTIVADLWATSSFGRVMGVVQAFAGVSVFGALLAGYLRDVSGSYSSAFLWLLLGVIPALYCFLSLSKHPPRAVSGRTLSPESLNEH
ncbi:MFS transporter [Pseudomaricurvus alkylphenolicus]|uniref:MFS transporter n=1 Tax=Pseudomaricurvus alkylphenolicus TaxID=1306991 RepID=UPI001420946D|nr:MFS transporter [Pseudomaricurvus alkylphenolicus]NIB44122.1 MFS transporter [Pseudomaricurvus alkylphenolicus]